MLIEFTKFKVKSGKTAKVDEWMEFLRGHLPEIELTLADEKMFVETIFRETFNGEEYLYWYSIQGEGGKRVEESNHEVDKEHLEFWRECIDESFKPVNLRMEVSMIREKVAKELQ